MPDTEEIERDIVNWVQTNYPAIADILDRGVGTGTGRNPVQAFKGPDDPYFIPSDEILTFKTSGRLVRLDVAIMAIHMMIARIYFRSLAHTVSSKLVAFGRKMGEIASVAIGERLAKKVAAGFISRIRAAADLFEAIKAQREMEAAIRRASLITQRELNQRCLGGKKPVRNRRRKVVWSRHKPKARK
jgi:hypothetical protein